MIAKRIENVAIKEWAEMAYKVNVQFNPFPINSTFREINSQTNFHVKGVENFFDKLEANNKLVYFTQQGAGIPGFNLTGFMMQIAKDQNIVLDEEGKLNGKSFNEKANDLYEYGEHPGWEIVGDALVCNHTQLR